MSTENDIVEDIANAEGALMRVSRQYDDAQDPNHAGRTLGWILRDYARMLRDIEYGVHHAFSLAEDWRQPAAARSRER